MKMLHARGKNREKVQQRFEPWMVAQCSHQRPAKPNKGILINQPQQTENANNGDVRGKTDKATTSQGPKIAAKPTAAKGCSNNNGPRFSALWDLEEMEMGGHAADNDGILGGKSNGVKSPVIGVSQNRKEGTASPGDLAVDIDTTDVVVSHEELLNELRPIAGKKIKAAVQGQGESLGPKKHKEKPLKDVSNTLEI